MTTEQKIDRLTESERLELTNIRARYKATPIRCYQHDMREGGSKWKRAEELAAKSYGKTVEEYRAL